MAADAWLTYNTFLEIMSDGSIDMDGDTFNMILLTSAYVPNRATDTVLLDISANELATANGYTAGGQAMTTVTWVESAGTVTFDSDDVTWTASGGSITARYAAIYDDTPTTPLADPLVAYSLLDNTPADVTATDGNPFTVAINASGIFTVNQP